MRVWKSFSTRLAGRQFLRRQVLRHPRRYGGAAAGATTDARNPHRGGERRNLPRGWQRRPRPVPVGAHQDVRMFKQHIERSPQSLQLRIRWTSRGGARHLRCPGFVAKTDAAAQEAYGPASASRCGISRTKAACSPTPLVGKTARRTIRAGKPRSGSLKSRSRKHCAVRRSLAHPIRWWASWNTYNATSGCRACSWNAIAPRLADHAAEREAIRLLAREVQPRRSVERGFGHDGPGAELKSKGLDGRVPPLQKRTSPVSRDGPPARGKRGPVSSPLKAEIGRGPTPPT